MGQAKRIWANLGILLLAAGLVSTVGAWTSAAMRDGAPAPARADVLGELRVLRQQRDAKQAELEVAQLQLDRVSAIMRYAMGYQIPADMATAVYDIALSEGIDPALAFGLVKVESGFNPRAKSPVGAIGLTQLMPSTAVLYEPSLTPHRLYDRNTNLRIGFRFLRDLLDRYPANMQHALLAYNRGPAKVDRLLRAGRNPANGYDVAVMKGLRRD